MEDEKKKEKKTQVSWRSRSNKPRLMKDFFFFRLLSCNRIYLLRFVIYIIFGVSLNYGFLIGIYFYLHSVRM